LVLFAAYLDLGTARGINTRLLIAFTGSMLSGVGLILYSRTVRTFSGSVATNFILAGRCMITYAVLTGLIPSDVVLPFLGVKVIVLRGLSAFLIMTFTIRALSVFNLEQRELINERLLRFSQSEKLTSMGILAAGIAHEINNPLTNISLNVEMLKDLVGSDGKIGKKVEAIERNIDRASRIAKELLHFSREKETDLLPTDLNRIISSVKNLLTSQPRWAIIRLNLQDIPNIMGIPWKLEEVFINLLMNSLDACSEKDSIEVKTFCRDQQVVATITDTGHGIKEEHIGRVFDPFFTTKEIGKGTGLGLSVCYNIIRQHGGTLALSNREQGGIIVTLTFPVVTDDN
jgi:signal transduction histidine kinase